MSRTDALADPLISSFVSVLRVPLLELYALLWRVGVVEVHQTHQANPPLAGSHSAAAAGLQGPICPDPSAHDSPQPSPRLPKQRLPELESSRGGPAGCSRAAG
ncbi:Rv1535 domain-containing protein [Mycobacterium sp.]|uniref:Rv1535 domain-containing protein n=1 Tax=Mycobacterium sp. TaxID=1785 RepID=UPI003BA88D53